MACHPVSPTQGRDAAVSKSRPGGLRVMAAAGSTSVTLVERVDQLRGQRGDDGEPTPHEACRGATCFSSSGPDPVTHLPE
jgi:hypothetical protein